MLVRDYLVAAISSQLLVARCLLLPPCMLATLCIARAPLGLRLMLFFAFLIACIARMSIVCSARAAVAQVL